MRLLIRNALMHEKVGDDVKKHNTAPFPPLSFILIYIHIYTLYIYKLLILKDFL